MSANGYMTDAELAPIDNGQRLRPDAARNYMAMRAAAAAAGVNIVTTEGYRDYARQVYYRNGWLNRLPGFYPAGIPGTSSHGWGLAVDLNTTGFGGTVFNWLSANAARFGFNNRQGRADNEHWHWVFDGTGTASVNSTPIIERHIMALSAHFISEKPDELVVFNNDTGGRVSVFQSDWDLIKRVREGVGNPKELISSAQLDKVRDLIQKTLPASSGGAVPAIDYDKLVAALEKKLPTKADIAQAVRDEIIAPD